MASTNWESDAMSHFDRVAAKIERTFDQLIEQLIGRKEALLRKVLQLREDFLNKEAARREAIQELEKTQQHLRQFNLKAIKKGMGRLSTVTKFPTFSFDNPTRDELLELSASYGEIYGGTEYEDLNEPIQTVGHEEKLGNFGDFRGLAFDKSTVYAADLKNGQILRFSSQGEFLESFGEEVLRKPWGVTVEEDNIFVTDVTLHSLLRFDKKTLQLIDRVGSEGSQYSIPIHQQDNQAYEKEMGRLSTVTKFPTFSFDNPTRGELLELSASYGEIYGGTEYEDLNEPIQTVGHEEKLGNFGDFRGLALDKSIVYTADLKNGRILRFSSQGEFLESFGEEVLKKPWGVTVEEDNIFVTDVTLHSLLRFDMKTLQLIDRVGSEGSEDGMLSFPLGLVVDENGDIYVADSENDRISIFSKDMEFLHCFGQEELLYPVDVKLLLGRVAVLDWSGECVHIFFSDGHHFFTSVTQGLGPECSVSSPLFFCMDNVENIFISGSNDDITIISRKGEFVKKFGGLGDKRGNYRGVAISENDRIFAVSNNSQHFLQIF